MSKLTPLPAGEYIIERTISDPLVTNTEQVVHGIFNTAIMLTSLIPTPSVIVSDLLWWEIM